jgi:hypothetical protein
MPVVFSLSIVILHRMLFVDGLVWGVGDMAQDDCMQVILL